MNLRISSIGGKIKPRISSIVHYIKYSIGWKIINANFVNRWKKNANLINSGKKKYIYIPSVGLGEKSWLSSNDIGINSRNSSFSTWINTASIIKRLRRKGEDQESKAEKLWNFSNRSWNKIVNFINQSLKDKEFSQLVAVKNVNFIDWLTKIANFVNYSQKMS